MGNAASKLLSSWTVDNTAMGLSEIFSPQTSVAIWRREGDHSISEYFDNIFSELGMGVRGVFSMTSLKQELHSTLPEAPGKLATINDIYLLSDMLTCLFDCDSVGLRIAPLTSAMCPRFHVDNIPVRLVSTYLGDGTEWLPIEAMRHVPPNKGEKDMAN